MKHFKRSKLFGNEKKSHCFCFDSCENSKKSKLIALINVLINALINELINAFMCQLIGQLMH